MEVRTPRLQGEGRKQALFLSRKGDYEAIERNEMRDEVRNILATIRSSLEDH